MSEKMMDALVKTGPVKGLTLKQVPVPTPGPGEVLIKIHKTAICGTDVHIYNWDAWSAANHEPAPGHRPRICGRDRRSGRRGQQIPCGPAGHRRRPHHLRRVPQLP